MTVKNELVSMKNQLEEERELKVHQSKLLELERTKANEDIGSCSDVTATGNYQIDLDGANYGLPPINVHCDHQSKVTTVGHNFTFPVKSCNQFDCHEESLQYKPTRSLLSYRFCAFQRLIVIPLLSHLDLRCLRPY